MITDFRLKVFKTVADMLSFTHAAQELSITQPAVTKHINELEKQLSVRLFIRSSGRVTLTPKGELLLSYANRILLLYSAVSDQFTDRHIDIGGEISIGASSTIAQYVLPSTLARFHSRYPAVKIKLLGGNTRQIEDLLLDEKLDFGIIEGNASNPRLHYETFLRDEIVLVTNIDNNLITDEEIETSRLKTLPLIIRESGSGTLDVIEKALSKVDLSITDLNIDLQLGSSESIKRYLLSSSSYAFISTHAILDELLSNKLKIIEVINMQIDRNFNFASLHGNHSRVVEVFKEFCTTP